MRDLRAKSEDLRAKTQQVRQRLKARREEFFTVLWESGGSIWLLR